MTEVIQQFQSTHRLAKIEQENFDIKVREAIETMLPYKDRLSREQFKIFILYILSQTTDKVKL